MHRFAGATLGWVPSIRSSRVVLPDGIRPATVSFETGQVVDIGAGLADVDFGDLVILPGLVDSHVHVNEPGRTEWEGFVTATRAAAAGGTTTIVDMPLNSIPPTVDLAALDIKRFAAKGAVAVDVAFWGGLIPGSVESVDELAGAGVCGFKAFLADSGVDEFPPMDAPTLAGLMPRLRGLPLLVHAEDPSRLVAHTGDPRAYSAYLATRPGIAEAAAVEMVAPLAEAGPVHILHVAGADAVGAIARHRDLTAETCPHYLTFTADAIPDGATAYKCAPPIRGREDREVLWEALGDGTLAMVVSDHSPAPPAIKDPAGGDFTSAWGGIASLELRLPATWDGARRRGYGLDHLAGWLAGAPAHLAGLDRKGRIEVGADADFAVFDPDGVTAVDARHLHQRHPVTPYDGMRLAGAVVATYLGGTQVFGPGADTARRGRLLRRGL